MSYPHGGLRTGRLGPPSTVQVGHPLRCKLVDAEAQAGPLVLRHGVVWSAFAVSQRVASHSVTFSPPLQLSRVAP